MKNPPYYCPEDSFDEYNDPDATACANGDYNTWEENEVFNDHEGRDDYYERDDDDFDYFED